VVRVGVLLDVQVFLHDASRVGQERPLRAEARAVLVALHHRVGRDQRNARVAHLQFGVDVDQAAQLTAVLGAVVGQ